LNQHIDAPVSAFKSSEKTGLSIEMTYQQYYNKLIKDLADSEKKLNGHRQLKGEKGYFDHHDLHQYMEISNDDYALLNNKEKVLKLIVGGNGNEQDKIDPAVIPGVTDV